MKIKRLYPEAEAYHYNYAACHAIVHAIGKVGLGVQIYGQDNIPESGPAILAANHRHWSEIFLFPTTVPKRHLTMVARHDAFDTPIVGKLFEKWGAKPIHRDEPTLGEMKELVRVLKEGRLLGIYPEGTREKHRQKTLHEADLSQYKIGTAWIARLSGAITIPVALYGMDNGLNIFRRRRAILFGEGMLPPRKKDEEAQWTKELMDRTKFLYNLIDESVVNNVDLNALLASPRGNFSTMAELSIIDSIQPSAPNGPKDIWLPNSD